MSDSLAETHADVLKGTWAIDPNHSSLAFTVRYAVVSTARGWFDDFSGTITIDPENPGQSSAEVEVKTASIDTKSSDRDAHLRSADFFDVEKHPTITFRSTRVETGSDPDRFSLAGDLTILGATKEVTFDLTFLGTAVDAFGSVRAGFEGETTVNRKDWGLVWNAPLEAGGFLLADRVKLLLEISAVKQ